MSDHAKAVELLRGALEANERDHAGNCSLLIREALSALSDERGEEEWTAVRTGNSCFWMIVCGGNIIAFDLTEATARKIASDHNRLPRLERANKALDQLSRAALDEEPSR